MAVEITLTDIGSGFNRTTINDNFAAIAEAFENSLGRQGTTPNSMNADIDMDSNDLLNVGDINTSRLFVDGEEFVPDSVTAVGDKGWSPSFAVVSDGDRRVLQLTSYVGGEGTVPTDNVGKYVGATQMETLIANGVDIRGAQGASGAGTGDMLAAQNLNDVASKPTAFANIKQDATESATGVVELATTIEAAAGVDTTRVVTPAGLTAFSEAHPSGAMVLLDEGSVSGVAALDLVFTTYTDYSHIRIILTGVRPSTNGTNLWLRFSSNGGSSFDSGVTDYNYARMISFSTNNFSASATLNNAIVLEDSLSNSSTAQLHEDITIYNWNSSARTMAIGQFVKGDGNNSISLGQNGGLRRSGQNTDAIRFLMSSGNISASYKVYGIS